MIQTLKAKEISIYELEEKFGIQLITEEQFFLEWTDNLPALTDTEKQSLLRVRSNYLKSLF